MRPGPRHDPSAAPLEILWQPPALISLVLAGEMLATILALAPGITGSRWMYFGLSSLLIQWISLLSLCLLRLGRATLARLRPLTVAYIAVATLLVTTAVVCTAAWLLLHDLLRLGGQAWVALWLQFSGIALVVGLMGAIVFQNHWNARQLAIRAKQAEIDALTARVQPHFLFNALNAATTLVHREPGQVERILLDLSDLFRAALAGPAEIDIADELLLARRYIDIESIRFGERMVVDWQLPTPLPALRLPRLSLQPLVENAVHHGIENSAAPGHIVVSLRADGPQWLVTVENSVPDASQVTLLRNGHKVGLSALQARLADSEHIALTTLSAPGRFQATLTVR